MRPAGRGRAELVSAVNGGTRAGNSPSYQGSVSAGGRFVAFFSGGTDLAPGRVSGRGDVFVRDRQTRRTELVSGGRGGAPGGGVFPHISADGRFVAFSSWAGNLVPGDTNAKYDAFVRDRRAGTTTRVSVGTSGAQGNDDSGNGSNRPAPAISPGGRFVAFELFTRQPGARRHQRHPGTCSCATVAAGGGQGRRESRGTVAAGGRAVAFFSAAADLVPGDTNGAFDVFVRSR